MSQPRSPVSEFLKRSSYSTGPLSKDELDSKPTASPSHRRRVSTLAVGLKSALVRSTDVARTFGSSSAPNSPSGTSEVGPPGFIQRTMSEPLTNPYMDKSLPDLPAHLAEAYAAVNRDAAPIGFFENLLNKIGDGTDSEGNLQGMAAVTIGTSLLLDPSNPVGEAIQNGINTFLDGMPVLMKALDEVAKLHPFIGVVVLAFQAVYALETKRRNNDRKIIALYVEMREMVAVLVQLKDVKDVNQIGSDGQTIRGRLQELSVTTAEDIKACANTCDTYSKKKLVVKIISGPIWEGKLLNYVGLFTQRKQDFMFALSVNTAVGVNDANKKLDTVEALTREIDSKMAAMFMMFQKLVSPDQQEVATFIQSRGGRACLENEDTVQKLMDYEDKFSAQDELDHSQHVQNLRGPEDIKELRREVDEKPEAAIKKNSSLFSRKFEIQKKQVQEAVSEAVQREGDRIISALNAGPHERLLDPDMYEMWKEMGWRGSTKVKHFTTALRDCYQEKAADEQETPFADRWALPYIGLHKAQAIIEAVDDDASGLITVMQLNKFTRARPSDWSLPHWISYWAVGWQITATDYCTKINHVISAMFHIRGDVKPANRHAVDEYLLTIWELVMALTHSVEKYDAPNALKARFKPYVQAEEERLRMNLEVIRYQVDDFATVSLVTGPGRIEMFILPLLYLILKRHLAVISVGCTHVLGRAELAEASSTWFCVAQVIQARISHMQEIFKQRSVDPQVQFKIFARGLFDHLNEFGFTFNGDRMRALPDPPVHTQTSPVYEDHNYGMVLNYPPASLEDRYDYSAYDASTGQEHSYQKPESCAMLGTWYCLLYVGSELFLPMTRFTSQSNGPDSAVFRASGKNVIEGRSDGYTLHGHTGPEVEGTIDVDFQMDYASDSKPIVFDGEMDIGTGSVQGSWKFADDSMGGEFVLRRSSSHLLFRPAPSIILESPARARWRFVLTAVHHAVKKNLWSCSYFLGRFQDRKRYVEMAENSSIKRKAGHAELIQRLSSEDAQFYASIIRHNSKSALAPAHRNMSCSNCEGSLRGARIICMDCSGRTTTDLCDDVSCFAATINADKRKGARSTHLPTHDIFKTRATLHGRYHGMAERQARTALTAARKFFEETENESLEGPKVACFSCEKPVAQPCWVCVECPERVCICYDCDLAPTTKGPHSLSHTLVRCQPAFREITAEERMIAMEGRLLAMEEKLATVGDRSSRMEDTLQTLATINELQVAKAPTTKKTNKEYSFKLLSALLMRF